MLRDPEKQRLPLPTRRNISYLTYVRRGVVAKRINLRAGVQQWPSLQTLSRKSKDKLESDTYGQAQQKGDPRLHPARFLVVHPVHVDASFFSAALLLFLAGYMFFRFLNSLLHGLK